MHFVRNVYAVMECEKLCHILNAQLVELICPTVNIVSCDFAIIVWCSGYYDNNAACYRIVSEARKVKCLHAMWRVSLHDPTGWYSCSCLVAADVLYDELKFPLMQIVLFGPVDRFLGKTKKNMIYCIKSKRFVCKTALYLTQSQTTTARVSI